MTADNKLRIEARHEGRLLHITLDAPKANVLDAEMIGSITAAIERHEEDPQLRAVAFEGAGRHFSFGASVEEHQADRVADMLHAFHGMFRALGSSGIPTMAIVRGQCLGGGLELASWCTWIFADKTSFFGQPEIKLAVYPPMASMLLPWRIGGGAAMDLCVSGRSIDAERALAIGLLHEVSADPAAACDAFFLEHLAALSPSSLRYAERAARAELLLRMRRQLPDLERMYVEELMATPDAVEGIAAFLDKRQPDYATR